MPQLLADILGFLQIPLVQSIIWSVIFAAITLALANVAAHTAQRLLHHDSNPLPTSSIIVNIVRATVYVVGGSFILGTCFGQDVSALITALGVGGIAVSLGFQDTLSNLISGLQLSIMGIIEPGDNVEIGGQRGIVRDVTWRHTTIVSSTGETIAVPNSVLNTSALVQLPPPRKVVVPISVVARGDELTEVSAAIANAAAAAARAVGGVEGEPSVQFTDVTAFGFTGNVVVWMEEGADPAAAKDAVVRAVAPLTRA